VDSMVEKTLQRFGKIDVLVNNAAPKTNRGN
jgi:NAD(P)-dependent dehydrogenase (short-subunit alcohol dehydrogenase family)